MSVPQPSNPIYDLVMHTLEHQYSSEGVTVSDNTLQLWQSLSPTEMDTFNQLLSLQPSSSQLEPSSPPPQQLNPIHLFVQKILDKQTEANTLLMITHRMYQSVSSTSIKILLLKLGLCHSFTLMSQFIGTKPDLTSASCTVASSQVFSFGENMFTIPAEIGLVKFSFVGTQIRHYRELIDPRKECITVENIGQVTKSTEEHKIPHEYADYKDLAIVLEEVHQLVHHSYGLYQQRAWVFINDSELAKTSSVLQWCANKSALLHLPLTWNMTCISISTLCQYLKVIFSDPSIPCDQAHFQSATYDASFECPVHINREHAPFCALSKAHYYARVLKNKFGPKFKLFQQQ